MYKELHKQVTICLAFHPRWLISDPSQTTTSLIYQEVTNLVILHAHTQSSAEIEVIYMLHITFLISLQGVNWKMLAGNPNKSHNHLTHCCG